MAPSEESPLEKLLRDAAPTLSLEERDRVMLECGRRDAMRGRIGVGIASSLATAAGLLGWVALWRPITADPVAKSGRAVPVDVIGQPGSQPKGTQWVLQEADTRRPSDGVWTAGFRPQSLAQLEGRLMTDQGPTQDAATPAKSAERILKANERNLSDWL